MTRDRSRKTKAVSSSAGATPGAPAEPSSLTDVEVSDLRKRNDALEQTNSELQCLWDYRSRLLARLTHELRNPLTSILGFTEILVNHENLTTAQEDFCRKIQASAVQIEANLTQLADLARLEAGHATLSLEEFSLTKVLRESCLVLERQARTRAASLDCPPDADGLAIVSDRSKVRQVLYNVLAHAISRSPEAAVVKTTVEKFGSDLVVRIEDEGQHLPESSLKRLMSDPPRIDRTIPTDELGLAMARQLTDVLGAKLTFQNRAPRGVVMTIQFPSQPPNFNNHD